MVTYTDLAFIAPATHVVDFVIGGVTGLLSLAVWKIYIEPIFLRRMEEKLDPYLSEIFDVLDRKTQQWLSTLNKEDFREEVKKVIKSRTNITEPKEVDAAVDIVLEKQDITVTAGKLRQESHVLPVNVEN